MAAGEREQGEAPVGETDRAGLERFRYEYGAQPLHLIAVVVSLLLCGYALLRINNLDNSLRIVIWIVAAALLHDLVALPFYSVLSRITHGAAAQAIESRAMMVHALNHVRIPAGLSLLLLLVYFPLILRVASDEYVATTGQDVNVYLSRWLLISAAMFLISGVIYAIRLRRGIPEPGAVAAPPREEDSVPRVSAPWRIGADLTLAASALAILIVAAALVVGLLTTGLMP
ncbi:MAG: hypothetical protein M3Q53_04105 [Actinomycetota bacterium]|nr:hypothetical protein [Actinomycetota bacterium]